MIHRRQPVVTISALQSMHILCIDEKLQTREEAAASRLFCSLRQYTISKWWLPWPSFSVAFIHQSDWASGTDYTEVQINPFYSKTNLLPVGVVKSLLVHSRKPQSAHFQWVSCPQGSHISMLAQVAGDTTASPGWSNNASMSAQERAAFPRSTSDPVQSNWNLRTNPLAYSMVGPCERGYPCPPSEFQSLVCHYFGRLGCRISTRHKSLAQFCSPCVTVSRPCRLSEFTPYRTLMVC